MIGDHPNYYIIEDVRNNEKSSTESRSLAVTQTPEKDNQLKLMDKTLYEQKRNKLRY